MIEGLQQTLAKPIRCNGIGLHSGQQINMNLLPSTENTGIVFIRSDLTRNNVIPALFDRVVDTTFCTVIANEFGVKVATIEHIMSALWGCNVDNLIIDLDGQEVPIMDGSSAYFVDLIKSVGTIKQVQNRQVIEISQALELHEEDKSIVLEPSNSFSIDFIIDFGNTCIGKQSYAFDETQSFDNDISKARTFGFMEDIESLWEKGLAKGASLDNAIGINNEGILNKEGLRYKDEFVRHKILDCIGDLYLAGARIKGHVKASKAGHKLNNQLLKKLFSMKSAFKMVTA